MKKVLIAVLATAVGSLIGYFGVLVSVFSDSNLSERLITISIILLIYAILSTLLGALLPSFTWWFGLILGAPGAMLVLLYYFREPNLYLIIYIAAILGLSSIGSRFGSCIGKKRSNK
jgi:hypothetical protein